MTSGYLTLKESTRIKKYESFSVVMDVLSSYRKSVTPLMALVLVLCDGTKTLDDIAYITANLFETDEHQASQLIQTSLQELMPFIDVSETVNITELKYKPEDFVLYSHELSSTKSDKFMPLTSPIIMTAALTDRCNFECVYCFKNSGRCKPSSDELTTGEWIGVIQQAKLLGVLKCNVTGGEPMMHSGFLEIVKELVDADIYPYISTNGSLITPRTAVKLSDMNIKSIQVSLDASHAELHSKMTMSTDTFRNVIYGIRHLRDSFIDVRVKSVITPYNHDDVCNLVDLCSALGVSEITLDKFNPSYDGRGSREHILTSEMLKDVERDINYIVNRSQSKIIVHSGLQPLMWKGKEHITPCGGLYSAFAIQPNGNLSACEQLDIEELVLGNIREKTLSEMWGSEKAVRLLNPDRSKLSEPCKSCEHLSQCRTGCYSHTRMYSENIFDPDPSCWKVNMSSNPMMSL